uniref:Uncharacterized protein n=1 Tax=Anguilla anguilla TaxID=7936 RepID=A0A0E9TI04_ANGAN
MSKRMWNCSSSGGISVMSEVKFRSHNKQIQTSRLLTSMKQGVSESADDR